MSSSASDGSSAAAFDRLARGVQRWIHARGWTDLADAQVRTVVPVLAGRDVLVTASTAGGKTEAAFLPILSDLVDRPRAERSGIDVLYVAPLKALINDQLGRLEDMCADLPVEVHAWHGDVSASRKSAAWRSRSGILLITPESVEGLLCHRGETVRGLLGDLRYVVVDELHAFPGSARGAQLVSLLHRLDLLARRRIPRIGLSATVGRLDMAAAFLRPGRAERVVTIAGVDAPRERRTVLRGATTGPADVAAHLYRRLRGHTNLVFANRRTEVEAYADRLRAACEQARVPNEFFAHHGSLAKAEREDVEARLRSAQPTTAVCTSTLEMGVDIGQVREVAQVRCPPSVAALRQRWGRSGRRAGEPSILRTYITEPTVTPDTAPHEGLRSELVTTVAMLELFRVDDWCEEPESGGLHLSTLVQQVLSLTAQHGGVHPHEAESALCTRGPFDVDRGTFAALLAAMHDADLLMSSPDGLLLPARRGERVIEQHDFLAAFASPEVYRVSHRGEEIGSVDAASPLLPGSGVVLAGRRWRVVAVHDTEIDVVPDAAGSAPRFPGSGAVRVHDRVRARAEDLYLGDDVPAYLDEGARTLLAEGRAMFARLELDRRDVVGLGDRTVVFPWRGDRVLDTLRIALRHLGVDADRDGVALVAEAREEAVHDALRRLASAAPPSPLDLAATVPTKVEEKWDHVLSPELLDRAYAARALDVDAAWAWLRSRRHRSEHLPPAPAAPVGLGAALALGTTPFAVVDVGTSGLSPARGHRVVEIAVVTCGPDGAVEDFWHTLLDPGVDVGPSRIHGLVATDVVGAPDFADVAGDVVDRLRDRIVVGHHVAFDLGFLRAEFRRAGHRLPDGPSLCTMRLADRASPDAGRSLTAACAAHGIPVEAAHSAREDALATAALLAAQLATLAPASFADLGVAAERLPTAWPAPTASGRTMPRVRSAPITEPPSPERRSAGEAAYASALERVVADGELDGAELQELLGLIRTWSLPGHRVAALHAELVPAAHEHMTRRLGVVVRTADRLLAY